MNARERITLSDAEIVARFIRVGYRVSIKEIAFTSETIEDFHKARDNQWWKPGKVRQDDPGLLLIEDAQPRPNQRTRDVAVVSFGGARAVMGVDIKPGAPALLPGDSIRPFAPNMEWLSEPAKALGASSRTGPKSK